MEKTLNKLVGLTGVILLILIAFLGIYFAFLGITNYKPEAVVHLEPIQTTEEIIQIDTPLTLATYNLGFGAYSPDFTHYKANGSSATAKDNETVVNNLTQSINQLLSINPDFMFLQELDRGSKRSYYLDQYEMIYRIFSAHSSVFAPSLNVKWLASPFSDMQGKLYSGQSTFSTKQITGAERISLPGSESFIENLTGMDPHLLVTRMPTSDNKELVLINIYLDPYTKEVDLLKNQLTVLSDFLAHESEKENYVIVGGSFNHILQSDEMPLFENTTEAPSWLKTLPMNWVPENFSLVYDPSLPTMRNPGHTLTSPENYFSIVDGFFVSDNVRVLKSSTLDTKFESSYHQPTYIQFELKNRRRRARTES